MKSLAEFLRLLFGFGGEPPRAADRRFDAARPLPSSRTQQTPIAAPIPPERPETVEGKSPAAQITSDQRIEWKSAVTAQPSSLVLSKLDQDGNGKRIDWSGGAGDLDANSANLIGVEDAYEHTPILEGEQIAFCTRDKVAYHLSTWTFLQTQNQGRCCICGQSHVIKLIRLPGTPLPAPQMPAQSPRVLVSPGEKVIGLEDVFHFIGLAVIVQDFVHEVYRSHSTGTYFIRFTTRRPTDPPFAGFKLVIRPRYQSEWTIQGIRIEDYAGHYVRVRGIVQVHQTYGTEILVNSPRVIELLN